jgi:hypothetical protein
MPGHTGKITAKAIAERGPQMVLVRPKQGWPFVIIKDGYMFGDSVGYSYYTVAKSYSLRYLMNIAKANS